MRVLPIIFVLFFSALSVLSVFGADSSSPDPIQVVTTASNPDDIPVGTILAWPVAIDPDDMNNWLECNGQSVNPSVYPELFTVIGPTVPDYRGLFLRGLGGKSAAINVLQKHSTYIEPHTRQVFLGGALRQIAGIQLGFGGPILGAGYHGFITGLFFPSIPSWGPGIGFGILKHDDPMFFAGATTPPMPISIIGTETETRPDNKAVRYLIRARP